MRDCFLFQRVETPTRCRIDTEPHILDLILCNQEESVCDISNESPIGKSDHSVLLFNYNCYMDQPKYKREKQFYDRGDYKAIRTELSNYDWNLVLDRNSGNVDAQWIGFTDILNNLLKKYIPSKVVYNQRKKGSFPLDAVTVEKIKNKYKLWKNLFKQRIKKFIKSIADVEIM